MAGHDIDAISPVDDPALAEEKRRDGDDDGRPPGGRVDRKQDPGSVSSASTLTTPGADAGGVRPAVVVMIDEASEKLVRRKLDRVVVPLVFLLYLTAFLDRSNIGNANLAGMSTDLGLSDSEYQWLLTIFYIPYIIFEWLAIMWRIVPPHIWACSMVFIWGLASTLQAVAHDFHGMMACRWFLAMAEAGYGPGVPFLLSFFYRRHELGVRCGIFLSAAPLATTFAGALAYGITSGKNLAIANWRLLFLVEGLPTLVLAVLVFFYLPDSPETARFLSPEEKEIALARATLQAGGTEKPSRGGWRDLELKDVLAACKTPQTWILPLMYFSCNVSFASLPVFLPTILNSMGYDYISSQGLTAPPYFLAFLVCIGTTRLADRTQQRGLIIITLSVIGGAGYVVLAAARSMAVRYFGVFLAAAGVFPAIANILPWVINNQGTDTKKGVGIALLNIIGQCGPLLGTNSFPTSEKPYYTRGMATCAAFMFFNAFLALVLRTILARKNREMERRERAEVEAAGGVKEEGVMAPPHGYGSEVEGTVGYRYVL